MATEDTEYIDDAILQMMACNVRPFSKNDIDAVPSLQERIKVLGRYESRILGGPRARQRCKYFLAAPSPAFAARRQHCGRIVSPLGCAYGMDGPGSAPHENSTDEPQKHMGGGFQPVPRPGADFCSHGCPARSALPLYGTGFAAYQGDRPHCRSRGRDGEVGHHPYALGRQH